VTAPKFALRDLFLFVAFIAIALAGYPAGPECAGVSGLLSSDVGIRYLRFILRKAEMASTMPGLCRVWLDPLGVCALGRLSVFRYL
jgi:hypothetical protein